MLRLGVLSNFHFYHRLPVRSHPIVNSNGLQETEVVEMLDIKEMQSLVGFPGEEALVEAVYNRYSDRSIVMLCEEDFLRKGYQPTCVTPAGTVLQGQVLILALDRQIEDFVLLNQKQVEIVKRETKLYRVSS